MRVQKHSIFYQGLSVRDHFDKEDEFKGGFTPPFYISFFKLIYKYVSKTLFKRRNFKKIS